MQRPGQKWIWNSDKGADLKNEFRSYFKNVRLFTTDKVNIIVIYGDILFLKTCLRKGSLENLECRNSEPEPKYSEYPEFPEWPQSNKFKKKIKVNK